MGKQRRENQKRWEGKEHTHKEEKGLKETRPNETKGWNKARRLIDYYIHPEFHSSLYPVIKA